MKEREREREKKVQRLGSRKRVHPAIMLSAECFSLLALIAYDSTAVDELARARLVRDNLSCASSAAQRVTGHTRLALATFRSGDAFALGLGAEVRGAAHVGKLLSPAAHENLGQDLVRVLLPSNARRLVVASLQSCSDNVEFRHRSPADVLHAAPRGSDTLAHRLVCLVI